jgi:hypothetical protein
MEHDYDLFYHALNYRSAPISLKHGNAQDMWINLEACVNRLIEREREACIHQIDMHTVRNGHDSPEQRRKNKMIEAIRARVNEWAMEAKQ